MAECTIEWNKQCSCLASTHDIPVQRSWVLYEGGELRGRITHFQQPVCSQCGALYQLAERFSLAEG